MKSTTKSAQLQIRVSPAQKARIAQRAAAAGLDMSSYVLARLLPEAGTRFAGCVRDCDASADSRYALAAFNAFLASLSSAELADAVASAPEPIPEDPVLANRIAAMVERACHLRGCAVPGWVARIPPLKVPVFDSELPSLRLYLLSHSPAPFRRRNLFVDASVGDQV
jgi:hypothetical protein